jgi:hypothetical protein
MANPDSLGGTYFLLHWVGFSSRCPRPRPRQAGREKQEGLFKKTLTEARKQLPENYFEGVSKKCICKLFISSRIANFLPKIF